MVDTIERVLVVAAFAAVLIFALQTRHTIDLLSRRVALTIISLTTLPLTFFYASLAVWGPRATSGWADYSRIASGATALGLGFLVWVIRQAERGRE